MYSIEANNNRLKSGNRLVLTSTISNSIVTVRLPVKFRSTTVVQSDAPRELIEQLHAVQEKLPYSDIVIVIDDLNATVGSDNHFLRHLMGGLVLATIT